jgi:hypothetical protein
MPRIIEGTQPIKIELTSPAEPTLGEQSQRLSLDAPHRGVFQRDHFAVAERGPRADLNGFVAARCTALA